jgi:hypothetical protein
MMNNQCRFEISRTLGSEMDQRRIFCFSKSILDYLENDSTVLEGPHLEKLVEENQLSAFTHDGFLLKIELEGGEVDVISGGRNFIKECQPRIVMEVNSLLLSHANATSRMVF